MAIHEQNKAAATPKTLRMSYEEYLAWADEDIRAEWVQGEVIVHMPAKYFHQAVVNFLNMLLKLFADLFDLGEVVIAPVEVRLPDSAREPDVLFIARENLERLTQDRVNGPPDLIIEIISDDSVRRDRRDKFQEYSTAGVREYWIVDPRPGKLRADFYELDERGQFALFATEEDEWVHSRVVAGFALRPEWLWQAQELDPLSCALQIPGVSEAIRQQLDQSGNA